MDRATRRLLWRKQWWRVKQSEPHLRRPGLRRRWRQMWKVQRQPAKVRAIPLNVAAKPLAERG